MIILKIYMNNQILVTGKNGQLGQSLRKIINNEKYLTSLKANEEELISKELNFIFVSRNELDLTNEKSLNDFFKKTSFMQLLTALPILLLMRLNSIMKKRKK